MEYRNIITINIEGYLVDYLKALAGSKTEPIRIHGKNFICDLIYRLIDRIPENCSYKEPIVPRKKQVKIELGWMGDNNLKRKDPSYVYFPLSKQRELENAVKAMFDNIFFNVIEITKEYTDEQYKDLIGMFCEYHKIDFASHFDALKKKHYRARLKHVKICDF